MITENVRLKKENLDLRLQVSTLSNQLQVLESKQKLLESENIRLITELNKLNKKSNSILIKNNVTHNPMTKITFAPFRPPALNLKDDTHPEDELDLQWGDVNQGKNLIGANIFEEFLIIGNSDIENKKPEILYKYTNSLNNDEMITILNFAFPFGIKHQKITDSAHNQGNYGELNEILLISNSLFQHRRNAFVILLKNDEDLFKSSVSQLKLFINGERSEMRKVSLLETSNPNHFKYCICFLVRDYIAVPASPQTQKNKKNGKITADQDFEYIETEKVLCFITYYPFIRFFTDIILSILNYFKINKLKCLQDYGEPDSKIFSKIDAKFLSDEMNQDLKNILFNIHKMPLPCFNSLLVFPNFENLSGMLTFQIPDEHESSFLEVEWTSVVCFKIFRPEEFLMILLSILLEKKIVFFTRNLNLLTSTILTFLHAMRPFLWAFPVIMNLPRELFEMMSSPLPLLIGVNKDFEFFKSEKIEALFSDCVFIFLDEENKIHDFKNIEVDVLSQFYHLLSYKIHEKLSNIPNLKDSEAPKAIKEVLNILRKEIEKELIPLEIKNTKVLNIEEITENFGKDKDRFVKKFVKTQMLSCHMQKIIEKK